ncbi:hypothetical protein HN789_05430 [archaeon]|nr:hypothetical protein [archaeon]MBT4022954.1 hypothetical protein [archaeon]MBT4271945.1 hypothetical protein [archaeon]MBT4858202.1 hypothetical protein [archaeon]MBT5424087.1 hypothetical protein [archaeon]
MKSNNKLIPVSIFFVGSNSVPSCNMEINKLKKNARIVLGITKIINKFLKYSMKFFVYSLKESVSNFSKETSAIFYHL